MSETTTTDTKELARLYRFGQRLKVLREAAGMEARAVATKAGVTMYTRAEAGEIAMKEPILKRILELLVSEPGQRAEVLDELLALSGQLPEDVAKEVTDRSWWRLMRECRDMGIAPDDLRATLFGSE